MLRFLGPWYHGPGSCGTPDGVPWPWQRRPMCAHGTGAAPPPGSAFPGNAGLTPDTSGTSFPLRPGPTRTEVDPRSSGSGLFSHPLPARRGEGKAPRRRVRLPVLDWRQPLRRGQSCSIPRPPAWAGTWIPASAGRGRPVDFATPTRTAHPRWCGVSVCPPGAARTRARGRGEGWRAAIKPWPSTSAWWGNGQLPRLGLCGP